IPEEKGFAATPAYVKADPRTADIDPNEVASLEDSRSSAEYERRLADMQDDQAYARRVAASGTAGWLGTQAGIFLDPAQLALGAVTGGSLGASTAIGRILA